MKGMVYVLILPQIVKTKWNYQTREWYEEKGYKFTKYNEEFEVNVVDLYYQSGIKIKVICDYCGKEIKKMYIDYIDGRKVIEKDTCKDCIDIKRKEVMQLKYGIDAPRQIPEISKKIAEKSRISKETVIKDFLEKGIIVVGEYVGVNIPIECICLKHQDKGIQKIRYGQIKYRGSVGCPYCNGSPRFSFDFIFNEFDKNGFILLDTYYINSEIKMKCLCKKHLNKGFQYISYSNLQRCEQCIYCRYENENLTNIYNLELAYNEFLKRDYILLEKEYINDRTLMKYKCNKHPEIIQEMSLTNLIHGGKQCIHCSGKRIINIDIIRKEFEDRGYILLSDEYINSNIKLRYICKKHPDRILSISYASFHQGQGCKFCALDNAKGKNHPNWQGGITLISEHLRHSINPWKFDSAQKYNFKCAITGKKFDIIHHLYGFNKIVKESLKELGLPIYKQVYQYTEEELKLLEEKCLELHYKYGLGVPLIKSVHNEFHKNFKKGNNTPEQFEEFIQLKMNEIKADDKSAFLLIGGESFAH